jgi:hypothetical protein
MLPLRDIDPHSRLIGLIIAEAGRADSMGDSVTMGPEPTGIWPNAMPFDWATGKSGPERVLSGMLTDALQDGVLLDIGYGSPASADTFWESLPQRPSAHIGIEPVLPPELQRQSWHIDNFGDVTPTPRSRQEHARPGVLVGGDLLEVLSQLPVGSSQQPELPALHVALRHTDRFLEEASDAYRYAVAKQIARIVQPAGVVFGVTDACGIFQHLLSSGEFDSVSVNFGRGAAAGFHVLSKVP